MILDKEEHRKIFYDLLENAAFHGRDAERVVEIKKAITEATVAVSHDDATELKRSAPLSVVQGDPLRDKAASL